MIAAGNNSLWSKLCEAIDKVELVDDERFKTNQLRGENHCKIKKLLEKRLKTKTLMNG
jgi:CoA:oxalate CoA-transferase